MSEPLVFRLNEDGTMEQTGGRPVDLAGAVAFVEEAQARVLSLGATTSDRGSDEFLAEFRQRRGEYVFPYRLQLDRDGWASECCVKTLDDNEVQEVARLMAERGHVMSKPMESDGSLSDFYAALMFVGTRKVDAPEEHYFGSMAAAVEWQSEAGLVDVVNTLRGVLVTHNPFLQRTVLSNGFKAKGGE